MWQILFYNFAAYKKINLGNAGRMTLYISPVCCERKNKDTWRHSHNKTVIYYLFFVVVIDWKLELSEQHITRASLRYFLQGSVITFIQYIWHVHGISFKWKNRKKEKPICQKKKRKMTDCTITKQFGSKPQREMPMACWQQASAEEAQKMQLQTGHPIICSYAADWVPAWKWEMFNSLDCFVLSIAV